jgi:putative intracellular protease/amidase
MSILLIVTNNSKIPNLEEKKTGYYLPEVAHPYHVFINNGYKVTFASPLGGFSPCDESSIKAFSEDKICSEFLKNETVQKELSNTLKTSDVNSKDFDSIYFAGGHGPMWDTPEDVHGQKLTKEIYEKGGVVGGVCHGVCGILNVKLSNDEYLIKDKKICSFTNKEEDMVDLSKFMPFMLQTEIVKRGGDFVEGNPWSENVQSDQRVVTGQNPASATKSAEVVVQLLSKKE